MLVGGYGTVLDVKVFHSATLHDAVLRVGQEQLVPLMRS